MIKFKLQILLTCMLMLAFKSNAQDPQFTQFYANPIYLNPAYTGVTYEHRFIGNYRNQWLGIAKAYQTYSASYDYNLADMNSGIGFQLWRDVAGSSKLTTTNIGASYSYHIKLTKFQELRGGIQFNYVTKTIDQSKLVFNDQLAPGGGAVSSDVTNINPRIGFVNINSGILLNSTEYWVGIAGHNLNAPNTSLTEGSVRLPMKISVHGGYRFVKEKKGGKLLKYVAPALNYRHQQKYDQLDIGVYYVHFPLNLGIWYRGLPLKHYKPSYPNRDAITFLVGADLKNYDMRFAYSYDLTLQRLIGSSTGSHEISVIYEIASRKKKTRKVLISCPKF
ncbi:MAG: type IX secretion system membrane protein PorP/SprF [Bacteroidota bacterium]|nr:type IX secretion system membrane protein PorP/SprF [Bacteroidota bacterium]